MSHDFGGHRPPKQLVCHRRGLISAFQNGVVQIRRMRLARVKRHDHALPFEIDFHIANSVYLHKRPAQLSHAFIAIFAFRRDFDCFQDWMIAMFREKRTGWVGIVRSCWVHTFCLSIREPGPRRSLGFECGRDLLRRQQKRIEHRKQTSNAHAQRPTSD